MAGYTFGDSIGQGVDEGLAIGAKSKELKLKQQQMAEQAIKDKYDRIDKSVDNAWKVVANDKIPDAVRLQHYNDVIVPGANLLMGTKLPPMDKFPDWGGEFAQKFNDIKELEKTPPEKGGITASVARASYSALMAQYASRVPEPVMSKISQLSFPTSSVQSIPGPEGTTTTRPVNEYGEPGPVLGEGSPKPAAGGSPSDLRSKAIDDIRDAIRIKAQLKSSPLADLSGWFSKKTGGAPSDKEQAMNQVNVNIALRAKDLGLDDAQTHKLVAGTITLEDLLGGGSPKPSAKVPPPAAAKAPPAPKKGGEKLDSFGSEAEARKAGKGKGDRVVIGGVSGTLQ